MSDFTASPPFVSAPPHGVRLPQSVVFVFMALVLVAISVGSFLVSTPFGLAVTFASTIGLCIARPAAVPITVITAALFQNLMVAVVTPLAPDPEAFDTIRAANFVMLVTAYGVFLVAPFLDRRKYLPDARPWLLAGLVVLGIICLYFALGAVRGDIKNATVYFRNTLTPFACLHLAMVGASLYRIDLKDGLTCLGLGALAYGYAELFFTVDFLNLFNGDEYIALRLRSQIESGYWERVLEQTGFVLRGLDDVMTVPMLNFPGIGHLLPSIFRVSGPNFHPISYAYAIAILASWLLFRGRWMFLVAALPLLLAVGSKGALVLILLSIAVKLGERLIGLRPTLIAFAATLVAYITAAIAYGRSAGDYHVLGFLAGLRDFASNPLGVGLGFGGNLSSTVETELDWSRAQDQGIADIPVESAIGVMLYQMGVAALVPLALLAALVWTSVGLYRRTGRPDFLFAVVSITVIGFNAVLQEEAIYSPLALGFCLLLVGTAFGDYWRDSADARLRAVGNPERSR